MMSNSINSKCSIYLLSACNLIPTTHFIEYYAIDLIQYFIISPQDDGIEMSRCEGKKWRLILKRRILRVEKLWGQIPGQLSCSLKGFERCHDNSTTRHVAN